MKRNTHQTENPSAILSSYSGTDHTFNHTEPEKLTIWTLLDSF